MVTNVDNSLSTGVRATATVMFYNELALMVTDMRWGLFLLAIFVLADFRYGWKESEMRYKIAVAKHDSVGIEKYCWHTSRAIRRTLNKCIDYLLVMLVFGSVGMAILEPIGISHIFGSWIGACIVAACEIMSIFGHFFYIRGVKVEKKTIKGFCKAFAIAIAKQKNEGLGNALEETLDKAEEDSKNNGL